MPILLFIYPLFHLYMQLNCSLDLFHVDFLGDLRIVAEAQLQIFQHYLNSIVLLTCPVLLFRYTKFSFLLLRLILRMEFSNTGKAC